MKKNAYENIEIRELLSECRCGDDAAFSELVRRYTPMMRKIISSFIGTAMSADELFAEACVALHSALGTYDISQNKVTFGLYARTCVYHRLIDFSRKISISPPLADFDPSEIASNDIDVAIAERERTEEILSGARALLSDYEYKILIYHIQGYKTAAIAAALGKSPKSVDNAKGRMFRRIRESLSGILDS